MTISTNGAITGVIQADQAAWLASSVSGAGPQIPRRLLALGTSITNKWTDTGAAAASRTIQGDSYLFWFLVAMRGVIKPENVINKGVSGNNTSQMLARYSADVAANYSQFDALIFEPGPNDYTAPLDFQTITGNITSIISQTKTAGKPTYLLVPTVSEGWTNAQAAVWQEVRNWMFATYNGQDTSVRLIDVSSPMADPLTGLPLSLLYAPTAIEAVRVHPSIAGAPVMGRTIAQSLPWSQAFERNNTPGQRDHYELIPNPRLQGNNASAARNFFAGAGITVTGGPDSTAISISRGTFTSVTIAPVTADGVSIASPSGGTRITVNTAGSDRSAVILRIGSSDASVGGTQYGRWDQSWLAATPQVFGDHRSLVASPLGVLTCLVGGTTSGSTPVAPAAYGMTVTDGTVTWLWQKLPAPGDVVVAEVEYEIESVTGGVGIKAQANVTRATGSEIFAQSTAGFFDESATPAQGLPGIFMPRKGVLASLPVTLTSLGFSVRHVFVDLIAMFPSGGSATIRIDRVSLRRIG